MDAVKSFWAEARAGKIYVLLAFHGVIAHFFPWRVIKMLGEHSETGLKVGTLGIASAIALTVAVVVFLLTLFSNVSAKARKHLGLLLIGLPAIAIFCQVAFWFNTGGTQKAEGLGLTLTMKDPSSVGYGLYVAFLLSIGSAILGVLRIKASSAETE